MICKITAILSRSNDCFFIYSKKTNCSNTYLLLNRRSI